MKTDRATVYRLAAETLFDARTINKVLRGEKVKPGIRLAVEKAAKKLKVEIPSKPIDGVAIDLATMERAEKALTEKKP